MTPGLLAAAVVLAAATTQGAAKAEAAPETPAPAAERPTEVEGVTVEKACRYVAVTGARTRRRVCSDDPESEARAAAGVSGLSSTVHKSHQSSINMSPRD